MSVETPTEVLENAAAVRDHFGEPLHVSVAVIKDRLDQHHRTLIAHSPFICIATADAEGQPVVSPKGDAPGFVEVLDDQTLLIPDRPGNNKVLGFNNLVENPRLSILFVIPGHMETLRVEGTARIVLDEDILERGAINGRRPPAALLITVTSAYAHCGKSMIRSHLWDPEQHVRRGTLPTLGQMIHDQTDAPVTVEQADELVASEYKDNLY